MKKPFWHKYGKDKICGITHTRLRSGKNKWNETYTVFLPCSHGFCRSALKIWILTNPTHNSTCPLCRQSFNPLLSF